MTGSFRCGRTETTESLSDFFQRDVLRHDACKVCFVLDALEVFVVDTHYLLTLVPVGVHLLLSS